MSAVVRGLLERLGLVVVAVALVVGGLAAGLWVSSSLRTVPGDTSPPAAAPQDSRADSEGDSGSDDYAPEDMKRARKHVTGVQEGGADGETVISTDLAGTEGNEKEAERIAADYAGRQHQRCREIEDLGTLTVNDKDGERLGGLPEKFAVMRVGTCEDS